MTVERLEQEGIYIYREREKRGDFDEQKTTVERFTKIQDRINADTFSPKDGWPLDGNLIPSAWGVPSITARCDPCNLMSNSTDRDGHSKGRAVVTVSVTPPGLDQSITSDSSRQIRADFAPYYAGLAQV